MSQPDPAPEKGAVPRLCFIGFGEAGQALAGGLMEAGIREVSAFDIAGHEARVRAPAERLGVRLAADPATALEGADYVFAAVTAASSLDAARDAAPLLAPGQLFVDVNSVSPGRKRAAAAAIGRTGGYLDLAIMAPVHPRRHQTPCLAAGPAAVAFVETFRAFGMNLSVAGAEIGAATQMKMVRSVMVKGLEALSYECFAAARAAGIEAEILDSLQRSYPGIAWRDAAAYNVSRMLDHGVRRAAEMREVALTLRELGVEPAVTEGTVAQQERLGRLALTSYPPGLEEMLDLVRRELQDANVPA
ncbi:NAD(P)-dependent oxidoreductase [Ancylobacter sonchi]|uniref:NAD(P)-dependent oxidoreductase n=1 Tax=Ancylobacter sonchi TaxID=1937790 RepID=UPI001BD4A4DD|nr:NAD(P)-dependent oxidoreductase [Ancylobacter sonchi]MBS7534524.1 NAD(P)-dependent oxidoreductase [Ancylobacter sonchi]